MPGLYAFETLAYFNPGEKFKARAITFALHKRVSSAAIVEFIAAKEGLSAREIETLMNKQSGLLGISGLTSDMRELLAEAHEENDRRAMLAIEIFCYRARKYIGAYLAP